MTLRSDLERWLEYVDSDPEDMGGGKYLTPNEVRLILARDAKQAPTDDERGIETWTNGPLVLNATGVADDRNGAFRTVVTVQDGWGRVVLDTRKWHRTWVKARTVSVEDVAEVIVEHTRLNSEKCLCGWADLGRSHARHVATAALALINGEES